jgi:hypothetical protein
MRTKYAVAALLSLTFAAPSIHAANLTLLVMETGIPGDGASGRMAAAWENGLLGALFDAGHVVIGSRPIRVADSEIGDGLPSEVEARRVEAELGGMDYFLLATVDQQSGEISLRLFAIGSTAAADCKSASPIVQRLYSGGPANDGDGIRKAALEIAAFMR